MTFGHVESETVRRVLTDGGDKAAIQAALNETLDAAEADLRAEESGIDTGIPFEVLDAREAAAEAFADGDTEATLSALRRFWSV